MNVVTVNGLLPIQTLAAAAVSLVAVLPHWDLGDDAQAMRTLAQELAFDVSILGRDPSRDDIRMLATARLRKVSARYRRAVEANGIDDHFADDWSLARPDSYQELLEDRAHLETLEERTRLAA